MSKGDNRPFIYVPSYVEIYGERHTGTNYLRRLIEKNLRATLMPGSAPPYVHQIAILARKLGNLARMGSRLRVDEVVKDIYFRMTFTRNLGWKHACAPTPQKLRTAPVAMECLLITLSKNPYTWLLSLYRRPHHLRVNTRAKTFLDFLTTRLTPVGRENCPEEFENPIVIWNEKNRSYRALAQSDDFNVLTIQYEDLLRDTSGVIEEIAQRAVAEWNTATFQNVSRSTKGDRGKDFTYYRRYYLEQQWREELTGEAIAIINDYLDVDIMADFGYQRLD